MHRLDGGKPIRDAIADAGLSIERIAEKTKDADPLGYGISRSTVGHMVSTGPSGRDEFNRRSCDLVARVLGKPLSDLFSANTPT
jgi:hypothetical protein